MGQKQREDQFNKILKQLNTQPFKMETSNKAAKIMQEFIISYFGMCFIQGYRIFQWFDENIVVLAAMQYQHTMDYLDSGCKRISGQFQILHLNFREEINENAQLRHSTFQKLNEMIAFLQTDEPKRTGSAIQVHFLFANNHKYSVVNKDHLEKGNGVNLRDFFTRDIGIQRGKHNLRILDERTQGTQLHQLVQLFFKGEGIFRNQMYLAKNTLNHYKFSYKLQAVINTVCLIIGKQILENNYITMTSQKWMRRSTMKAFKRLDLLLRRQDKVCIIDWKFSKTAANDKIGTKAFMLKNKEYFQLARKQYNVDVELKFYCFHHKLQGHFHRYTCAEYQYQFEEMEVDSNCEPEKYSENGSDEEVEIFEDFNVGLENLGQNFIGLNEPENWITSNTNMKYRKQKETGENKNARAPIAELKDPAHKNQNCKDLHKLNLQKLASISNPIEKQKSPQEIIDLSLIIDSDQEQNDEHAEVLPQAEDQNDDKEIVYEILSDEIEDFSRRSENNGNRDNSNLIQID